MELIENDSHLHVKSQSHFLHSQQSSFRQSTATISSFRSWNPLSSVILTMFVCIQQQRDDLRDMLQEHGQSPCQQHASVPHSWIRWRAGMAYHGYQGLSLAIIVRGCCESGY
jgi:hypothetical protein